MLAIDDGPLIEDEEDEEEDEDEEEEELDDERVAGGFDGATASAADACVRAA